MSGEATNTSQPTASTSVNTDNVPPNTQTTAPHEQAPQQGTGTTLTGDATAAQQPASELPEWARSLPEEYHSNHSVRESKDLDTFVKNSLEAQKLIGKDKIVKPGENASQEELDAFYEKLGRPKESGDYKFEKPQDWPEQLPFNEGLVPKAQEIMHKHGLTAQQAEGLWKDYHNMMSESGQETLQTRQTETQNALEAYKQEVGSKFDGEVETARMALKQYGDEGLISLLNETGLGDHPAMIKAFAKAGANLRDDNFVGNTNVTTGLTPTSAKARIAEKETDTTFMNSVYDPNAAGHKQAAEEWKTLHKVAYGEFT